MRLTIFGSTGGVGRNLARLASDAGHELTFMVREQSHVSAIEKFGRCITGNVRDDSGVVREALRGADAILSTLGPRGHKDQGVLTDGTRQILSGMQEAGPRRFICISAAPVARMLGAREAGSNLDSDDDAFTRWVLMPIVMRVFRYVYEDAASMEQLVRESGLDWTIVRPPRLIDSDPGPYRTAEDRNIHGGREVARSEVAELMLLSATTGRFRGHAVGIAR